MENFFQFIVFSFLENELNRLLLMPQFSTQNSRYDFLKISFPQDKRGGENYDLLHQSSVRKYEDVLENRIIYILHYLTPWQFDTKITSEKIATLMKGGFL